MASNAQTSLFGFKDYAGYEKCLSTEGIEEVVYTDTGAEKKWIGGMELKERCAKAALPLADQEKDANKLLEAIDTTRRLAGPQLALPMAQRLVKLKITLCSEMKVYDLLLKTLKNPTSTKVAKQDFEEARKLVLLCAKDKTFKADFLDERSNGDHFIRENACKILTEAKLAQPCGDQK